MSKFLDVTYTIEAELEMDDPDGHFASGNEEADRKMVADIRRRANAGDVWAWAFVQVHAEVEIDGVKYRGTDSLGACSYESEADFKKCNDYYADMRQNALDDLICTLHRKVADGKRAVMALKLLPREASPRLKEGNID